MKTPIIAISLFLLFISCEDETNQSQKTEKAIQEDYHVLGDSIAANAQSVLLSHVASALNKGGVLYAIDYCNLNAIHLTDSLSEKNYSIARISEKNRNKSNGASQEELSLLRNFTKENNSALVEYDDKTIFYKAIYIGMPTCLKCHGTEDNMDKETLKLISERYPEDKATGYKEGDLRGAWKIVFDH